MLLYKTTSVSNTGHSIILFSFLLSKTLLTIILRTGNLKHLVGKTSSSSKIASRITSYFACLMLVALCAELWAGTHNDDADCATHRAYLMNSKVKQEMLFTPKLNKDHHQPNVYISHSSFYVKAWHVPIKLCCNFHEKVLGSLPSKWCLMNCDEVFNHSSIFNNAVFV